MTETGFDTRRDAYIDAQVHEVWDALTKPAQLVRWWGDDESYHMTEIDQEMRVGGAANYRGRFADGVQGGRPFEGTGVVRMVLPYRLLEYTRLYPDAIPIAEETLIRYELAPDRTGTHLWIKHSGFRTTEAAATHGEGWDRVLAWLRRYVAKG
jgi:uncharacterized protein YndB with AHSA1/START domain